MTFKRYKLTLPDKARCTALGIKFEGQESRTRLWLMGVAMGVKFAAEAAQLMVDEYEVCMTFNIVFSNNRYFHVDCDSNTIMQNVTDHLSQYGVTVEEDAPGKDAGNFLLVPVQSAFARHMDRLSKPVDSKG